MCPYYRGILKNWTKSKCYLILHFLTSKTFGTFTARSNLDPTVTPTSWSETRLSLAQPFTEIARTTEKLVAGVLLVECERVREREKVRKKRGKEEKTPVRLVFKR